jgi:fibronectin-binding autotransporter adhesin
LITFTYTVSDGTQTSNPATVTLQVVAGKVITWTGAGPDNYASDPLNWAGGLVPGPLDVARFDGTSSKNAIFDANFGDQIGQVEITSTYQGTVQVATNLSVAGSLQNDGQLEVQSGTLTLNGGGWGSGQFMVDNGGTLLFNNGTYTALQGTAFLGLGLVQVGGGGGDQNVGNVDVAAGATVNAPANGTLAAGGAISGAGNYTIGGQFTWTRGAWAGGGTTTVQNGGTLTISGGGPHTLAGRSLINGDGNGGSLITLFNASLTVSQGAGIANNGMFDLVGNNSGIVAGPKAGSFVNNGGFYLSGVTSGPAVSIAIPFSNNGYVKLESGGILAFTSAFIQANPNAVLDLGENVQNGEIQGRNMTMFQGSLQGGGSLVVTGQLIWGMTEMKGSGMVQVNTGALMLIQGSFTDKGFAISNAGTIIWQLGPEISLSNGAQIVNQVSGVFRIETGVQTVLRGDATTAFYNLGTVQ